MALIVKGDMPTKCVLGGCLLGDRCRSYDILADERPSDCPILGEIPDEHGRLIDADKLKKELLEHGHPGTREWYYAEVDQFIDECPTVLEASI